MIKALWQDTKMNFGDYGIRFLPRLLIFPFTLAVLIIGEVLQEVINGV